MSMYTWIISCMLWVFCLLLVLAKEVLQNCMLWIHEYLMSDFIIDTVNKGWKKGCLKNNLGSIILFGQTTKTVCSEIILAHKHLCHKLFMVGSLFQLSEDVTHLFICDCPPLTEMWVQLYVTTVWHLFLLHVGGLTSLIVMRILSLFFSYLNWWLIPVTFGHWLTTYSRNIWPLLDDLFQ